ncbi:MAG TPA: hypothetical protein VF600_17760 [Abditibacteriaceae bacterium]
MGHKVEYSLPGNVNSGPRLQNRVQARDTTNVLRRGAVTPSDYAFRLCL